MVLSRKYNFYLLLLLSAILASPAVLANPTERITETGLASWYGIAFQGRPTSSGEPYDRHQLTAAHKTLPLQTIVRVTNLQNQKSVVVRINDRGPFVGQRIIDLSEAAAAQVRYRAHGLAQVKVEVLRYPDGSKQRKAVLAALSKIRAEERERQRYVFEKPEISRKSARAYLVRQPSSFFTLSALPATALVLPADPSAGSAFLDSLPALETDDSLSTGLDPDSSFYLERGEAIRTRSVYVQKGIFHLMSKSPTLYV